jgi:hypothetical protein
MPPKRTRGDNNSNNEEAKRKMEIDEKDRARVASLMMRKSKKSPLGLLEEELEKMKLNSKKGGFRKSKNKKNKKINKTKKTKKNKKKY